MRKLLAVLFILSISCSNDDSCSEKKEDINQEIDLLISQSTDESQIAAYEAERDVLLSNACN